MNALMCDDDFAGPPRQPATIATGDEFSTDGIVAANCDSTSPPPPVALPLNRCQLEAGSALTIVPARFRRPPCHAPGYRVAAQANPFRGTCRVGGPPPSYLMS